MYANVSLDLKIAFLLKKKKNVISISCLLRYTSYVALRVYRKNANWLKFDLLVKDRL